MAASEVGLALDPDYVPALTSLAAALSAQRRYAEAEERLGRACELAPSDVEVLCGRAEMLGRLRRYGQAIGVYRRVLKVKPSTGAPLSGDLRAKLDSFTDVPLRAPERAVARIGGDEIDVLVDLAGLTAVNGLEVLAHRPAPVQAHFLGYGLTAGADVVDYLITDPVMTSPSLAAYVSERLVYLPHASMAADLVLDTPQHGGGVTPVARVCASLLSAAGILELIAEDAATYERKAMDLATDATAGGRSGPCRPRACGQTRPPLEVRPTACRD